MARPHKAFDTSELYAAGKLLWASVVKTLPEGFELTEHDAAILRLAAHQADDLAVIEQALKESGPMIPGSRGQTVPNPLIGEARQARLAIKSLLGAIPMPDEDGTVQRPASIRASKAARTRWAEREARAKRRAAIAEAE